MMYKVSSLSGALLIQAAAKAAGTTVASLTKRACWQEAIIDRERIECSPSPSVGWFADYVPALSEHTLKSGHTRREAAMRSFVAHKFGSTVEL